MVQIGPGFWVVFVYYSVGTTAIATTIGAEILLGRPFAPSLVLPGIVTGLVVGTVAAFAKQTTTLSLTARNAAKLRQNLNQVLGELGYSLYPDSENAPPGFTVYAIQSRWKRWFSGKLFVSFEGNSATIAGRASLLDRLQTQLDVL